MKTRYNNKRLGIPELARRYVAVSWEDEDPMEGLMPEGFTPITIACIQCYTYRKQPEGDIYGTMTVVSSWRR